MNLSGWSEKYTGSVSGVGTTGATILITSPRDPPPEGSMMQITLWESTGLSSLARCDVYEDEGGNKIATYEDPDVPGEMIEIDDTGDAFAFSDPGVRYTRGPTGTFAIYVETDDATDSSIVYASVVLRGEG